MDSDVGGEIEGEVTRVEAVKYVEGAVGHAVGSFLFVAAGLYIWFTGDPALGGLMIAIAFLLSGNGLSMWAWTRLQRYFASRSQTREPSEDTRSLKVEPFSQESIVTMKTGAVMVPSLAALLLVALGAVHLLGLLVAGSLFIVILVIGNLAAIANAYRSGL